MGDIHEVTNMFHNRILPPTWQVWAEWTGDEISYRVCDPDGELAGSVVGPARSVAGGVRFVDSQGRWRNDAAHVVMAVSKVVEMAMPGYRRRHGLED